MTAPLMPRATAVWLVENTTLTFRQIAVFCEIHELEIQAMADGDVGSNIRGISPIDNGQLTWDEIHRCEKDITANLKAEELECNAKLRNLKAKKVLSPSQRQEKPNAVLWVLKNYPTIKDSLICKLIGTTKTTIDAIRKGTHRDMANLKAKDPVSIGLCSETDIDNAVIASQPKVKAEKVKKTVKKSTKKSTKKVSKTKTKAKVKTKAKKTKKTMKTTTRKKTMKTTTKKTEDKKVTTKKVAAKKATVAKKATTAKKTTVKKVAAKKPVAKKTTVKKVVAKKPAAKKTTVKKVAAKKPVAKKTVTKKVAAKKPVAKKTVTKKVAAKKPVAKKTTAKKVAAKKPVAKKTTAKKTATKKVAKK